MRCDLSSHSAGRRRCSASLTISIRPVGVSNASEKKSSLMTLASWVRSVILERHSGPGVRGSLAEFGHGSPPDTDVRKPLDRLRMPCQHHAMEDLDHNACYRAVKLRDARFDGRFFTAVRTTEI